MKRVLAALLALTLILSLTACGGKTEPAATPAPAPGSDAPLTRDDGGTPATEIQPPVTDPVAGFDPNADLQTQMESLNRNNLTPEQIAEIEADAKADGVEIQWEADGSLTIVEDGSTITTSGTWPDNEFTKLVPAPKAGTANAAELTDDGCIVAMTWTVDETKAYAAQLKAEGFTEDADEQEMAQLGLYYYSGVKDGVVAAASLADGIGGISITKSAE